jgi:two-component system, OmpR family, sensor histidine kinase KdpD
LAHYMDKIVQKKERKSGQSFSTHVSLKHYLWTFLTVLIVTVIGKVLAPFFDLVNIVLFYLLPVLISAVRWGRGPSFFAAFLGVLAFDFFFVPPVLSFTVSDVRYVFSFVIFLLIALVTGTMATKLRNELEKTRQRERRTLALYALSREIAAETDLQQVLKTFVEKMAEAINGEVIVLIHDPDADVLREVAAAPPDSALPDEKERAVAHWVLEHGQSAGKGTEIIREAKELLFPVKAEDKTLAVLAIKLNSEDEILTTEQLQLIEAFTNLAAVAIIRVQLAKEAEQAKWLAESERLHTALLNSISHDLRTPLASITGAVTSLLSEENVYSQEAKGVLLQTIKEEAQRMNRFVANLLDMVRLESGILKPNKQWCDIQDIVGVVLREINDILQGHPLRINIPQDLPLVKADFILMEQVIINLLENTIKYSPPDSEISISAHYSDKTLLVTVADRGPVIPMQEREHVFDKFYRLHSLKHVSGTGLGLSICKGIIEAHGGKIWVDSPSEYGNRFTFSLPISEQPSDQLVTKQGADHAV